MKRVLLFLFLFSLYLIPVSAEIQTAASVFSGFSGIPIGSVYYQGGP